MTPLNLFLSWGVGSLLWLLPLAIGGVVRHGVRTAVVEIAFLVLFVLPACWVNRTRMARVEITATPAGPGQVQMASPWGVHRTYPLEALRCCALVRMGRSGGDAVLDRLELAFQREDGGAVDSYRTGTAPHDPRLWATLNGLLEPAGATVEVRDELSRKTR